MIGNGRPFLDLSALELRQGGKDVEDRLARCAVQAIRPLDDSQSMGAEKRPGEAGEPCPACATRLAHA